MDADFISRKILIAGLGLIGGSVAKAMHQSGFTQVFAFDRDAQALGDAKHDGVIQEGYTELKGDLPVFDLVLCCLSPAHVLPLYEKVKPHMTTDAVFAEVGGIKTVMIAELNLRMNTSHQLLSLHPMAGREKTGYAHSDAAMFSGSVLIMIPTSKTGRSALGWAKVLELIMDFKNTMQLSADEHDQIIAHVSHIPHVAALAIKAMYQGSGNEKFAGGSYRAVTRVADINASLWAGLMTDNKTHLLESITEFKTQIERIENMIAADNREALETLLEEISKS